MYTYGLMYIFLTSIWLSIKGEEYNMDFDFTTNKPVPSFVDTPTNFTFKQGQLARLECSVNNLGTKKVVWRRASDFNPLTIGTKTFVGNYRIHVEHTPLEKEWNLLIKKVQLDDAGRYECQVSSKLKNLRRFVNLNVIGSYKPPTEKPIIVPQSDIKISGPSYVEKGSRIILVCNATGDEHPPDDLDWFKDGDKLSTDHAQRVYIRKQVSLEYKTISSVLEIDKAKLKNAGVYICRTSDLQITRKIVDILNSDTYNVKRGTLKDNKKHPDVISHGLFSGTTYSGGNSSRLLSNSLGFFVFVLIQTCLFMCSYLQT